MNDMRTAYRLAAAAVRQRLAEQHPGDLAVLDGIASLMSKSLVLAVRQDGEPSRLLLLETVREYGLECLEASGEAESVRAAHARYYLHLAEEAEQHLSGQEQARWLAHLEHDHCNLQAALAWFLDQYQPEKGTSRGTRYGFPVAEDRVCPCVGM